jgi:bifunctional enzyme CysN/CysC
MICICAFVSPHQAVRQRAKEVVGPDRFLEVYLDCPVDICKQRDPNGVYALAEQGKIAQFPGVTAAFEPPKSPDLALRTDKTPVDQCVDRIVALLKQRGFIP